MKELRHNEILHHWFYIKISRPEKVYEHSKKGPIIALEQN